MAIPVDEDDEGRGLPEPEIQSCFSHGWRTIKRLPGVLLVVLLVYVAFEAVSAGFGLLATANETLAPLLYTLEALYGVLVLGPLLVGYLWTYLRAVRGEDPTVRDLFAGFKTYTDAVAVVLIVSVATLLGLLLFILPGIYVGLRLAFAPLLVLDRGLATGEALKTSWRRTSGHVLRMAGLALVGVVALALGALLLGIGIFPAGMLVSAAVVSFYHAVLDAGPAPLDEITVPATPAT